MPTILPASFLNLDFGRMGQASGDNYATELSKLDGRLTFARASTGTRINAAGLVESVASGHPRFDFDPVSLLPCGILIEESRTNYCLSSATFDASQWSAIGGATRTAAATTCSGIPLDLIADNVGGFAKFFQQIMTVPSGVLTLSFVIKKSTSPQSNIEFYDSTLGVNICRAVVTWVGAVPSVNATIGTFLASEPLANGGYRLSLRTLAAVGANSHFLYVAPATSATAGDTYLGAWQVEPGQCSTSIITTTSATVTRAAETLTMASVVPWMGALAGTWTAAFRLRGASAAVLDGSTSSTSGPAIFSDATNFRAQYYNGAVQADLTLGAATQFAEHTLATSYSANAFSGSLNGGTVVTDAAGVIVTPTALVLGAFSTGASVLNGWLKRLAYQPHKVSDLLLKQMSRA